MAGSVRHCKQMNRLLWKPASVRVLLQETCLCAPPALAPCSNGSSDRKRPTLPINCQYAAPVRSQKCRRQWSRRRMGVLAKDRLGSRNKGCIAQGAGSGTRRVDILVARAPEADPPDAPLPTRVPDQFAEECISPFSSAPCVDLYRKAWHWEGGVFISAHAHRRFRRQYRTRPSSLR